MNTEIEKLETELKDYGERYEQTENRIKELNVEVKDLQESISLAILGKADESEINGMRFDRSNRQIELQDLQQLLVKLEGLIHGTREALKTAQREKHVDEYNSLAGKRMVAGKILEKAMEEAAQAMERIMEIDTRQRNAAKKAGIGTGRDVQYILEQYTAFKLGRFVLSMPRVYLNSRQEFTDIDSMVRPIKLAESEEG